MYTLSLPGGGRCDGAPPGRFGASSMIASTHAFATFKNFVFELQKKKKKPSDLHEHSWSFRDHEPLVTSFRFFLHILV